MQTEGLIRLSIWKGRAEKSQEVNLDARALEAALYLPDLLRRASWKMFNLPNS